ncbi:unnamed protein product, partial [Vitis vinifera]|uniref:Suppressor of disruption of TFIIS n=1 Tax=Vitis vinifera TaxID=29760 RepID=D7THM2_VITVI
MVKKRLHRILHLQAKPSRLVANVFLILMTKTPMCQPPLQFTIYNSIGILHIAQGYDCDFKIASSIMPAMAPRATVLRLFKPRRWLQRFLLAHHCFIHSHIITLIPLSPSLSLSLNLSPLRIRHLSLIKMEYGDIYLQAQRNKYDCLLFDLDDTLYPLSSGLAKACRNNIEDYMVEKLGIEKNKIADLGNLLYKNYGTTMAGLRAIGYDFDYDEYHSFVHGRLPYENLKPDPVLRSLLLSLPIRKVIFTNADKVHAAKALSRLGLEDCFEGVICFETLNPSHKSTVSTEIFDIIGHFSQPNAGTALPKTPIVCKPSEAAIERALRIANINPQRTLFFEDSARNIQSGKRVGLHTVLVGTSQRIKGADFALESIHNMREALPELWEGDKKSEVGYAGQVAVETPVTA